MFLVSFNFHLKINLVLFFLLLVRRKFWFTWPYFFVYIYVSYFAQFQFILYYKYTIISHFLLNPFFLHRNFMTACFTSCFMGSFTYNHPLNFNFTLSWSQYSSYGTRANNAIQILKFS